MTTEAPAPPKGEEPKPRRKRGRSQPDVSELIYAIARDRYRFAVSPTGLIAMEEGPDWPVAIPLKDLRPHLSATFMRQDEDGGRVPSRSSVANALDAVEGAVLREGAPERDPQPRVARSGEHELVVDLHDGTGRAAVISPRGVVLEHAPPSTRVVFARTPAMGALPEPDLSVDPADLVGLLATLLNMQDDALRLVVGWLVAALIPDIPHPVLILNGEQGTAKSTAARILTRIIDPGPAPLRQPPKDVDAWTTSASASWVVCLDNVSKLNDDVSDALCRAVTGDGLVKRRLYTDNESYVISMRRAILMTTIEAGIRRGDLAERSLPVLLQPIGDRRVTEREIEDVFAELHPQLIGGLMRLASRVLAALPTTRIAHAPRMADFALVLAAVDDVLDWDGATLTTYLETLRTAAADTIEANPAAAMLISYLDEHGSWTGSAGQLLEALNARFPAGDSSRPMGWPHAPNGLTKLIVRLAPALRSVGWEYAPAQRTKTARTFTITPCAVGEETGGVASS